LAGRFSHRHIRLKHQAGGGASHQRPARSENSPMTNRAGSHGFEAAPFSFPETAAAGAH
jgi:hypothetical protein